jgi:tetratricopeptide (TPR) repeat protein
MKKYFILLVHKIMYNRNLYSVLLIILLLKLNNSYSQDVVKINREADSVDNILNEKNASSLVRAKTFTELAVKYNKSNELYKSLVFYRKALGFYDAKQKKELGNIYFTMGRLANKLYDFEEALEYYFKARQIFHEINDINSEANVIQYIAFTYSDSGLNEISLKYNLLARKFYLTNPEKFKHELMVSCWSLGVIYQRLNKKDSVIFWYKTALSCTDDKTSVSEKILIYNNLGDLFNKRNLLDSAKYYFAMASKLVGDDNNVFKGVILANLGEIKMKEKKYGEALQYLKNSLEILLNAESNNYMLVDIYLLLKNCYREMKDYKTSLMYFDKYINIKDSIASNERLNNLVQIEGNYKIKNMEAKTSLIEKEKLLVVKQNRIKTIWQYILIGGILILILIGAGIYRNLKISLNNKELHEKLLEQEKRNLETQLELGKAELELEKKDIDNKNKDIELKKKDIENKNKELEYLALRLVEKNQFIESIEEEIQSLKGSKDETAKLLKITNNIRNNISIEKKVLDIEKKINDLHAGFYNKLKEKHPDLTKTEKRISSLLLLDLDIKETVALLDVSYDSVKKMRQRVRKKFNLKAEDDISESLKNL